MQYGMNDINYNNEWVNYIGIVEELDRHYFNV